MRLAVVLCFLTNVAFTQSDGYYITNDNDTIRAKFNPDPRRWSDYERIKIIDSTGAEKTFRPADIKGYFYARKKDDYAYVSKPTEKGGLLFLSPLAIGAEAKLYFYSEPNYQHASFYYTLEAKDGRFLFLGSENPGKRKEKVQKFYADDKIASALLDKYFPENRFTLDDIIDFVTKLNDHAITITQ